MNCAAKRTLLSLISYQTYNATVWKSVSSNIWIYKNTTLYVVANIQKKILHELQIHTYNNKLEWAASNGNRYPPYPQVMATAISQ